MKNPKTIYILIGVFCFFAIVAGIYAEFFVAEVDKNNVIMPSLNQGEDNQIAEKTQEELKTQFTSLFTNNFNKENYDTANIQKLDASKDIVYNAITLNEQKENYEVNINLPVVNIQGDVAAGFNKITQDYFANKASEVLSNKTSNKIIYSVNYTSYINENILSVVIQSTLKEGNNPQRVLVQTYNYNLLTGEKVELIDMLSKKNIVQSDCQKKINETVEKAKEEAQTLVQSGYSVYNRDLSSGMYQLSKATTYFLGPNGNLYIIFAYGNQNFTSEMDIIWYE